MGTEKKVQVVRKELIGHIEKVNASGVYDKEISIKGKTLDLLANFKTAIEAINVNGQLGKLDKLASDSIDYYESFGKQEEADNSTTEGGEEQTGGETHASLKEKLIGMDRDGLKAFIKAQELSITVARSMEDDAIRIAILTELTPKIKEVVKKTVAPKKKDAPKIPSKKQNTSKGEGMNDKDRLYFEWSKLGRPYYSKGLARDIVEAEEEKGTPFDIHLEYAYRLLYKWTKHGIELPKNHAEIDKKFPKLAVPSPKEAEKAVKENKKKQKSFDKKINKTITKKAAPKKKAPVKKKTAAKKTATKKAAPKKKTVAKKKTSPKKTTKK